MKKLITAILLIGFVLAALLAWRFLGSATLFKENKKTIYIKTGQNNLNQLTETLFSDSIISNKYLFEYLANRMRLEDKIRPGKYVIEQGASLFSLVKKFRNNDQETVNLVITKLRTKEDLARLIGKKFECDSARIIHFLNSEDSLKEFQVNPENAFTFILPNTYTFFWTSTPQTIFRSLYRESEKFWNDERLEKAASLGITAKEAYIIASIVEEETNAASDKPNIASVYINRLKMGMPLQADPTVKYALKDFSIRRVLHKHLQAESPYNTYRNKGLPPGPVCTPSLKTLDAVLNSNKTDYLYFVANSDFSGTHIFTTNYADHLKYAKAFQKALTIRMNEKNKTNP